MYGSSGPDLADDCGSGDGPFVPVAAVALPLWIFQVIFGIGVGWLISSINVVLRDMQSLINIISLMLMMISPIAYTPDMIPAGLRPFLRLNPSTILSLRISTVSFMVRCLQRHPGGGGTDLLGTFLVDSWVLRR